MYIQARISYQYHAESWLAALCIVVSSNLSKSKDELTDLSVWLPLRMACVRREV
jgi:hypothetical protein